MLLNKIKFILGAMDPEMELIKSILDTIGANYELAVDINGALVNPTSAYECVNTLGEADKICFVECRNPEIIEFISIDHHNRGDFGFLLGAKRFLQASSLGQLLHFLAERFETEFEDLNFVGFSSAGAGVNGFYYENEHWLLRMNAITYIIPEHIVLCAATDHCSGEAYQGNCPGVSLKQLINTRIHTLSDSLKLAKDIIKEKLNVFQNFFSESKCAYSILDLTHLELGVGYSEDYLLIRESAIINNRPIAVLTKNELNGGKKLMLLALTEKQVEDFLATGEFNGLKVKEPFGVPVRGYAGGMLE